MGSHAHDLNEIMSNVEREFVLKALALKMRTDGRTLDSRRRFVLEVDRSFCLSRAEAALGQTRVLSVVSAELVKPAPERPTEGFLAVQVHFSSMASPMYEAGGARNEEALELRLFLEDTFRDCNSIDLESFCVLAGKSVWSVRVEVRVLDQGGNVTDAAALSAIAALLHFRRPQCSVSDEQVVVHSEYEKVPVPLNIHHIPICTTFALCELSASIVAAATTNETRSARKTNEGGDDEMDGDDEITVASTEQSSESDHESTIAVLVDPSQREELVASGFITLTVNSHGELCSIQKNGGNGIDDGSLLDCVRTATAFVDSTRKLIDGALALGEDLAEKRRLSYRPGASS